MQFSLSKHAVCNEQEFFDFDFYTLISIWRSDFESLIKNLLKTQ